MSKSIKNKKIDLKKKSPTHSSKKSSTHSSKKSSSHSSKKSSSHPSPKKKFNANKKISRLEILSDDNIFENNDKHENDSFESFEKQINKIRDALQENYAQQKKLMHELDILMSQQNNKISLVKFDNRTNSGNKINFDSEPVPLPLKKLLMIDSEFMPRSQVVKLIYEYLTNNKLCNKKTKEISPDEKLIKIFKMNKDDTINYYNLQSWLKKLYCENKSSTIDNN